MNVTQMPESWIPLEKAIGPAQCEAFMWMGRAGTVEHYKHIDGRRYLLIDALTGAIHDISDRLLSKETALEYARS